MAKYKELAAAIVEQIGGLKNVSNLTHCVTRLRFNLKNDNLADLNKIKQLDGVVGSVNKGGQVQVIIGPHVKDVHDEVLKLFRTMAGTARKRRAKRKVLPKYWILLLASLYRLSGH